MLRAGEYGSARRGVKLKNTVRSLLIFVFDLFAVVVAWLGGSLIRFNFEWPEEYVQPLLMGLTVMLVTQAIACRWAGLYRGMWVFASLPDLKRVLKAVAWSAFMAVEVVTPEEYMGDVMGDLSSRRGRIGAMEARGNTQVVNAQVPLSEMFGYSTDLRSRTQGRATYTMQFAEYQQVPAAIAEEIVKRVRGE
jgi:hypothetical protein